MRDNKQNRYYDLYEKELLTSGTLFRLCDFWQNIELYEFETMIPNTTFAIYGAGEIGKRLVVLLEKMRLPIQFIIDGNEKMEEWNLYDVYGPNDEWPDVDMVIVSSMYYYEEIETVLKKRKKLRYISIDYFLDELSTSCVSFRNTSELTD